MNVATQYSTVQYNKVGGKYSVKTNNHILYIIHNTVYVFIYNVFIFFIFKCQSL